MYLAFGLFQMIPYRHCSEEFPQIAFLIALGNNTVLSPFNIVYIITFTHYLYNLNVAFSMPVVNPQPQLVSLLSLFHMDRTTGFPFHY